MYIYYLKYIYSVMFQCQAIVADSGPALNQYCMFDMDSILLKATFNN